MGKENAGANQAQKRCNRLNHRKDPLRPRPGENDMLPRTVKEIPDLDRKSDLTDAFVQQIIGKRSASEPAAE
jgi:hypothetical protein